MEHQDVESPTLPMSQSGRNTRRKHIVLPRKITYLRREDQENWDQDIYVVVDRPLKHLPVYDVR